MRDFDVQGELVKWIAAQTKVLTIRAHQGGEQPPEPYIMVNFTTSREVNRWHSHIEFTDQRTEDNPEGRVLAAPVIEVEWQFSVHAYGNAPTDILRPLKAAAKMQQAEEPLLPLLTIHEMSQIRNVPDWDGTQWEPRAQVDVFVRGRVRDAVVVDAIDQIEKVDIARM